MKKVFCTNPIIFTAILLVIACKKEPPSVDTGPEYIHWPAIKTLEATKVDSTTAKLNGTVNGYGLSTTVIFEYGTTTSYGSTVSATESPVTKNGVTDVSAEISGLTCGITYHFRIKADNSKWINFYSPDSIFTSGHIPTLKTTPVSSVATTTAVSGGNIIYDGCISITLQGVCWSKSANPTTSDSKTSDGVGSGQYISNIIGLTAGTTYHIRAYATNSAGTAYGDDVSFSTLGHSPTSITQPATNVSVFGAVLNGTVNANDLATTVTFEYGTTTSYDNIATATQSPITGNTNTNVSADITGLTASTTYHFRVKTVNSLGTSYGDDLTFVTTGQTPSCLTQPATNVSATGATLNGTVNANDLSTTVTFEYGTTIGYGSTVTAAQSPVTGNTNTNVSADISGLAPGTKYHFRVNAENSLGVAYGSDMEFFKQVPAITQPGVPYLTSTTATLYSTVNANNFSSIVIFEYGTTTNYGQEVTPAQSPVIGNTYTDVVVILTGLTCGTTYHFRVKAENSIGTSYSNDITFSLAQKPALITYSVSGITDTTAVSGGNIISDGCLAVTARGVQWSLSPTFFCGRPPCKFSHTNDGTGTGSFTSNLTGLRPNITYYVRAFATNSTGTTYGNVISFTTLP